MFLLWLLGMYLALCVFLFLFQDRLVYFPESGLSSTPRDVGLAYREVRLETEAGERVYAWFVPHPDPRGTVLFCHGNAGNISHRVGTLRLLHDLGLATLIFDYPGYGLSEGSTGEQACYRAARAADDWLRAEGCERIVVWGRSLGGAVAAQVALERPPRVLVLESTFTSMPELGQRLYPWLPARWLTRNRFDTLLKLSSIDTPVLVIHSEDDEVIPSEHGYELYRAAGSPKRLVTLIGDHNNGFMDSGPRYTGEIDLFLDEYLK